MSLQFYGWRNSTCSNRVSTVLEEKGVKVEFIEIDLMQGEQKNESYINDLHPFGKVPVLKDNEIGVQIFESRAIAQYIVTKYKGQGTALAPSETDLKAYALYQQALSIEQSYFDPIVTEIAYEKHFKGMKGHGPADEARVETLLAQLDLTLQGYERVLSKQKFLAGDSVTLADLYHLPYGTLVEKFGFAELVDKYPAFKKWWETVKSRESWKKVTAGRR